MSDIAVVIPIYKETITELEIVALTQCMKVLSSHEIIIIAPVNIKIDNYKKYLVEYSVKYLPEYHFKSHHNYDRMMLSKDFYYEFIRYKYILIYQLDAYVFSDKLVEWCQYGFDYVGAPWVDHLELEAIASNCTKLRKLLFGNRYSRMVGNGGYH